MIPLYVIAPLDCYKKDLFKPTLIFAYVVSVLFSLCMKCFDEDKE